jgi:hypothetical protein
MFLNSVLLAKDQPITAFRSCGCDKTLLRDETICVCGGVPLHGVNAPSPDVLY